VTGIGVGIAILLGIETVTGIGAEHSSFLQIGIATETGVELAIGSESHLANRCCCHFQIGTVTEIDVVTAIDSESDSASHCHSLRCLDFGIGVETGFANLHWIGTGTAIDAVPASFLQIGIEIGTDAEIPIANLLEIEIVTDAEIGIENFHLPVLVIVTVTGVVPAILHWIQIHLLLQLDPQIPIESFPLLVLEFGSVTDVEPVSPLHLLFELESGIDAGFVIRLLSESVTGVDAVHCHRLLELQGK